MVGTERPLPGSASSPGTGRRIGRMQKTGGQSGASGRRLHKDIIGDARTGVATMEGLMPRLRFSGLLAVAILAVACGEDVTITLDPTSKSLLPGESATFTATVSGTDDTSVTWSVKQGAAGGTVTADGVYTAPARSGQFQVVATSVADPEKSATATVSVATSAVLLTGTAPVSPSSDNNPLVQGTAESGAGVKIFAGDDCDGVPLGSGVAGVDGRFEIAVTVPSDSTTTFRARVTSAGGVTSECSTSTLTYVEDSTSPASAIVFGTSVASPSKQRDIQVEGTSEAHAVVRVYLDGACEGTAIGSGTADDDGAFAVAVQAPANTSSRFYVRPEDQARNVGPCSATSAPFIHDDIAPAAATFLSTDPASPSNENSVSVIGLAETGATVALYDGASCLLKLGEGPADAFTTDGLLITVQSDRITRVHAIVTDAAGNASVCSPTSIEYVEDSSVEAPALDVLTPVSPSTQRTLTLVGTSEELSTIELFADSECGGTVVASVAASASGSFEFTLEAPANATSTWSARSIDLASNVSSCSGAVSFTHDDEAPAAPRMSSVSPASPAKNTTPVISGAAEDDAWVRLYTTSGCTGAVAGESAVVGGQFAIEVSVEEDSTTRFYATATDAAGNASACSSSFVTYVEQSSVVVTLAIEPESITLAPGAETVFVAQVSGTTNAGVEWSVEEEGGGSVSASGDYVAPDKAGTYHVIATSLADRSVTATAVVTVVEDAPSISVLPSSATVFVGQTFEFTATTLHFEDEVFWEVSTPDGGFISSEGQYVAPQLPGRYVVVARSGDGAVRGTATVEVKLPEITGTVQAPSGLTGRIFISVRESGPNARWEPVAGTSIESPGAFTVRGLPRLGSYVVEARMPSSGVPSETTLLDPFDSRTVDLTDGPGDDLILVLEAGDDESRPAPQFVQVITHGVNALAMVLAASDEDGRVWTNTHRIYVSTSQPATAENAFFTREVSARESLVVLPPLEPQTQYFASAVGIYAGEPGPAATFGPFEATEVSEGFTISGQVHVEGDLPAGPIFVVSMAEDESPEFVRLAGTSSPLDYALSGLSDGAQMLAVLADLNGDGLLHPDEMRSMESSARTFVVDGADVTDADLHVNFGSSSPRLRVSTYASYAAPSSGIPDYFSLMLRAEPGQKPFVRATVIAGPLPGLPYDMALWAFGGPSGFVYSPPGSSQKPVVGTTYTVEAVDVDGEIHLLSGAIERVIDAPTATSPMSVELSATPDFAWSTSQSLPEGSTWGLSVYQDGSHLWSTWDLPLSQRSVAWNFDGEANAPTLARGRNYSWTLELRDRDDNGARAFFDFSVPVAVEVTPSTLTLAPGGTQTLLAEVVGSPGEALIFSLEEGHGSIDSLGNYTAPTTPGVYTVTVQAASHLDAVATVTIHVVDVPQVAVTPVPQQVTVGVGGSVQLNAVVSGTADQRLTWRVMGGEGEVDGSGRFTAGSRDAVDVVVATSVAEPTKYAVFFVATQSSVPTLSLSTTNLRLTPGETSTIGVSSDGSAVAWQVLDGAGPSVTDGVVDAGRIPGAYRVVASLVDHPSVTATATLVVAHPDLSGVVTFEGTPTGPVVVQLFTSGGDYPVAGTVVDGPGAFTLRGVSHRGEARLVAWMDSSGSLAQRGSDARAVQTIEVTDAMRFDLAIALAAPTPELPGAPQIGVVAPFDSGAFLFFDPSTADYGRPTADSHRVLVSTNASPDENNSVVIDVPAGSESVVLVSSLANGEDYYFRVAADGTGGTSWSDVFGPVTIGAPAGGTIVSGVVESSTPMTGPLYVAVVGESFHIVRIDAPAASQPFTVTGVTPGTYEMVVIRDANASGTIDAGEFQRGETIVVVDQPVTGLSLVEASDSVRASVTTRVSQHEGGTSYGLTFRLEQGSKAIRSVAIVGGPEFPLEADLGFRPHGVDREFIREYDRHERAPVVGDTYSLRVTYLDGTSELIPVSVTRVWASVPVALSPVGVGSTAPTFTWSAPAEQASSTFTYYMGVHSQSSGGLWWKERLPQSQTSIAWNADGEALASSLSSGETYSWFIGVEDELGNMAQTFATFTVE